MDSAEDYNNRQGLLSKKHPAFCIVCVVRITGVVCCTAKRSEAAITDPAVPTGSPKKTPRQRGVFSG
ncbi:MAG: hypothetical protein L0K67_06860, partial [Brevibacterium sp.]|nr:hypothetical protein [Brevibacterium sp.]